MIHHTMIRLIPLKLGGIAMLATAVGGFASTQISAEWTVDLRTVCAVGAIVIPGTWWLSGRIKEVSDKLTEAERVFSSFERRFDGFQDRLDKLPCHNWKPNECSPSDK